MKAWIGLAIPLGLLLSFAGGDKKDDSPPRREGEATSAELTSRIDTLIAAHWKTKKLAPAPAVDDLTFVRRVYLDLLGTIPSLQELRKIEAQPKEGLRTRLIDAALNDPRFNEVLAERLARIAVGGPDAKMDDLTYRRRRLISWLTVQVEKNRGWDDLTREMLTAEGLTTDNPATNFTVSQEANPVKLAARSSRAFLGIRIDCAQCHDHPFTHWTQRDFEGLAAWFGRVRRDLGGVKEVSEGELEFVLPSADGEGMMGGDGTPAEVTSASKAWKDDEEKYHPKGEAPTKTEAEKKPMAKFGQAILAHPKKDKDKPKRQVSPAVPFGHDYLPTDGKGRRRAFSIWITHPANPFFAKAFVNRTWYWLMGRGLVEPLDELDTTKPRHRELLRALSDDFIGHGFDIRRLVKAIVSTRAYGLSSRAPEGVDEEEAVEDWAVYPLKRLRSDQLASALIQAGSFWTFDEQRAPLMRLARWGGMNDFKKRHADDLDQEEPEQETLLQRLHLLNGKTTTALTKDDEGMSPVTRLPALAPNDRMTLDVAFLMTLTRRPTQVERDHFAPLLAACVKENGKPDDKARARVMADLFWSLFNSTEFAWIR